MKRCRSYADLSQALNAPQSAPHDPLASSGVDGLASKRRSLSAPSESSAVRAFERPPPQLFSALDGEPLESVAESLVSDLPGVTRTAARAWISASTAKHFFCEAPPHSPTSITPDSVPALAFSAVRRRPPLLNSSNNPSENGLPLGVSQLSSTNQGVMSELSAASASQDGAASPRSGSDAPTHRWRRKTAASKSSSSRRSASPSSVTDAAFLFAPRVVEEFELCAALDDCSF